MEFLKLRDAFVRQKDRTCSGRRQPLILDRTAKVKKVTWTPDRSCFEQALKYIGNLLSIIICT